MTFVDTSVWIDYFKGKNTRLVEKLNALLDEDHVALAAPVRIELLSGASKSEFVRLKRVLSALPLYYPERTSWALIERWVEKATAKGHRFGAVDLIIASIVHGQNGSLWSLDRDFERMKNLRFLETLGD